MLVAVVAKQRQATSVAHCHGQSGVARPCHTGKRGTLAHVAASWPLAGSSERDAGTRHSRTWANRTHVCSAQAIGFVHFNCMDQAWTDSVVRRADDIPEIVHSGDSSFGCDCLRVRPRIHEHMLHSRH